MSKKKSNQHMKTFTVIVGVLLIAAGLGPYIADYYFQEKLEFTDFLHPQPETDLSSPPAVDAEDLQAIKRFSEKIDATLSKKEEPSLKKSAPKNKVKFPPLHDSDPYFIAKVNRSIDTQLFEPMDIIRKIVVFTDNFSRGELVSNFSPIIKPSDPFEVVKQRDNFYITESSYKRYDKYANAVESLDVDKFINLYIQLTPLLDEAYKEIGYTAGSFTQTFDRAIEHFLDTPIIHYRIQVYAPSAMYKYSNEHLEALPATQKLLLRMGPDNLLRIKEKLFDIQSELQRL